ncbi:MAG: TCR/Tet family MFS transporter [Parvibaculum sp.]|nr:TCR/Tet family MFS transporter [Parvibaculum sp.]
MTDTQPKISKHAITFIFITMLIDSVGLGIILPVLPQLIEQLTGDTLSNAAVYGGWLLFVYAAAQFLCAPILGNLSDRFGRRPVLLMSLVTIGLDYILMGLAPTVIWLFIGRIISGIAGASYSTANAYIADITPPEKRAQSFGLMGAAFGVGFIIGPVIGGLLGSFGPRMPFYVAAGLALANALYGFLVIPETLSKENRRPFSWKRANTLGAFAHLRSVPIALTLAVTLFFHQMAHFVLPAVWSFYVLEKFNWSTAEIGYSLGFAGLLMALVQGGLIGKVIAKIGSERAAYVGLVFAAMGYFGYAFAPNGLTLYIFLGIASLAGLAYPSINAIITTTVPANAQGEMQGALGSVSGITAILAPILMTQVFGYFTGPSAPVHFAGAPFLVAGLFELGAIFLLARVIRQSHLK